MGLKKIHYGPFSRIGDRYNTFINPDHFMGRNASADTWIAPTNASQEKDEYTLEVCLPGFKKEEVSIELEDDVLEVSAKKADSEEKEYLTREIETASSGRKFSIPKTVDRDRISANMKDGILTIKLGNKKGNNSKKVKIA